MSPGRVHFPLYIMVLIFMSFSLSLMKSYDIKHKVSTKFCNFCLEQLDPHRAVMAAPDFNRRQSVFMSFYFILSNTTRLAPFPLWRYACTRIRKGANWSKNGAIKR